MEILKCTINGVEGWKCGENGVCHIGLEAKQEAFRDQKKLKAAEFEKNPAPLPENPKPEEEKSPKKMGKKKKTD